jgi:Cu/Ag efflux protein CusF
MKTRGTTILAAAALLMGSSWTLAQQPTPPKAPTTTSPAQGTVAKANMVKVNATITAIDPATRTVTLKDEKGNEDTYTVSDAVQRFNELKVGQMIAITYYESMVLQVLKPGEQGSGPSFEAALNRAKSQLPAGSIATQTKATVTVKAVDPAVPSVTVTTDDGRTVTRKLEDKQLVSQIKPGDKVNITFTQALITAVQ